MKRVAVIQSNYLPWKGYFDIVNDVDLFVFYDDVQFTKNDWRNRNRIKTQHGASWLTIPVGSDENRLISQVEIPEPRWARKHWKSLQQYYAKAPFFAPYREFFENVYLDRRWTHLSELNQYLIREISARFLGITARFEDSSAYNLEGRKSDRLLNLLSQVGATKYVSGPSADGYLAPELMRQAGIELVYKSYSGYPEYPQFFPPFDHAVSILDLLFHTGARAPDYIWGWRSTSLR